MKASRALHCTPEFKIRLLDSVGDHREDGDLALDEVDGVPVVRSNDLREVDQEERPRVVTLKPGGKTLLFS